MNATERFLHVWLECSISNLDMGAEDRGYEFSQDEAVISINYCRRRVRINQSGNRDKAPENWRNEEKRTWRGRGEKGEERGGKTGRVFVSHTLLVKAVSIQPFCIDPSRSIIVKNLEEWKNTRCFRQQSIPKSVACTRFVIFSRSNSLWFCFTLYVFLNCMIFLVNKEND